MASCFGGSTPRFIIFTTRCSRGPSSVQSTFLTKPCGTIRIIFYGGSAVFDIKLSIGKDWPHKVENILRQKGFSKVEVINAGIPGHASFDSFGRLFTEGKYYSADYVIVYNAGDDIKYFHSKEALLRSFKPYVESSDPLLNYQGFIDYLFCNLSQLYVRLRHRYYVWKLDLGGEGKKIKEKYSSEINDLALKQYKLNVLMFVELARSINAVPILITQARLVTQHNTKEQKACIRYGYQMFTHQTLCNAFDKTDEIIFEVAREKKVALIDASKYLTGKSKFFEDHVHLNDRGSKEIARIIARDLVKILKGKQKN